MISKSDSDVKHEVNIVVQNDNVVGIDEADSANKVDGGRGFA